MTSQPHPPSQAQPCSPLFLPVPEVARRLGIGQTSLWALLKQNAIASVRIGRRRLISTQALEEFANSLSGKG